MWRPGYLGVWNSAKIPPAGLLPTKARSAGCSDGMDGRKSDSVLRGVWGRLAILFIFVFLFFPFFPFFSPSRGEEKLRIKLNWSSMRRPAGGGFAEGLKTYSSATRGWALHVLVLVGNIRYVRFLPPSRSGGISHSKSLKLTNLEETFPIIAL